MLVKGKVILYFILIIMFLIITGCSNSQYENSRHTYVTTYYKIANSLDIKDPLGSLKKLETDNNKNEIEKLKEILDKMKNTVPSGMEKDFKQLADWYEEMSSLVGTYTKWNYLSVEEKQKVNVKLINIEMTKDWLKKTKQV